MDTQTRSPAALSVEFLLGGLRLCCQPLPQCCPSLAHPSVARKFLHCGRWDRMGLRTGQGCLFCAVQGRSIMESGEGGERAMHGSPVTVPAAATARPPLGLEPVQRALLPVGTCALPRSPPGCREKNPSSVACPDPCSDRPGELAHTQGQPRSPGGRPTPPPPPTPSDQPAPRCLACTAQSGVRPEHTSSSHRHRPGPGGGHPCQQLRKSLFLDAVSCPGRKVSKSSSPSKRLRTLCTF